MRKNYIVDTLKLVVVVVFLGCVIKFFGADTHTSKTKIQRIEQARKEFDKVKFDYSAIINEIHKAQIDNYFHVSARVNRQDVYHIFDVYHNDITLVVPYYGIHCILRDKYGSSITNIWYMRGQVLFAGIGQYLLYSELPCDEINYCDTNRLEICVYPNLPTQEKYWMCEIDKNWYIIDSDLSGGITTYEGNVAKGIIME